MDPSPSHFYFQGQQYTYYCSRKTRFNERKVEVPIAMQAIAEALSSLHRVVEVGNVMAQHTKKLKHDVVDLYDKKGCPGIMWNEDAETWETNCRCFDLLISVSTIEHIGFDYGEPKDPGKVLRTLDNMRSWLTPRGRMFVTASLGFNPALDERLLEGRLGFQDVSFLARVSDQKAGIWEEIDPGRILEGHAFQPFQYRRPRGAGLPSSDVILIGENYGDRFDYRRHRAGR